MPNTGSTEDRLAIRELLDQYADGVNQLDAELWGDTWAEDSVWNLPVMPGMEEVKGRDNIVAGWQEAMKFFKFVHMVCASGSIQLNGDRGTVRSYESGRNRRWPVDPAPGSIRRCGGQAEWPLVLRKAVFQGAARGVI